MKLPAHVVKVAACRRPRRLPATREPAAPSCASARLLVFAVGFLAPLAALAAPDAQYLAELQSRARELRLAERPEWLKLVHYAPNLAGRGVHGLVDSPDWYNARDGKSNPGSELDATLAAFFSDVSETKERQNPQCQFIARRAWLDGELHVDRARLPWRDCPRYEEWHQ